MNILRLLLILFVALLIGAMTANAQTECPPDKVCITREAALKAIQDGDTVKAQAGQIDTLNKAISDLKDALNKMRVEFATASGENTQLKQQQVRDAAIIELLLKSTKKKCMPFSICL